MNVLVKGDVSSAVMTRVRVCVEALVADGADARFAADASQLPEGTRWEGWHPDLVIVCQHWSDEYGEADVQRFRTFTNRLNSLDGIKQTYRQAVAPA